ncbi:MAG TPA: hypothetical protein V6C65_09335, partial [Allocoleopsis sp.]
MSNNETLFGSVDDLLNASMDDIDDLPPMGVPPTGHYNLDATIEKTTIGDDDREVIIAKFVIDEINEIKEGEDPSEAAVGQQFTIFFHVLKKDG